MLLMLIPCSECRTIDDIINILEEEFQSGVPSKVPSWYWLALDSNNMDLSQIGYNYCHNEGCFKTEGESTKFLRCAQCKVPFYCSKRCQITHWKRAHKRNCDKEALFHRQTKSRQAFAEHCINSSVSINRLDKDCLLFYREKRTPSMLMQSWEPSFKMILRVGRIGIKPFGDRNGFLVELWWDERSSTETLQLDAFLLVWLKIKHFSTYVPI